MSVIELLNVKKSFGKSVVIREFTDTFQDGEFVTLLGPSGCGKTTLLRMIAGFEKPTSGEIRIDGKTVSGNGTFVPPEQRGIGMVFQSYAVWPHMTVFDNVAYPLRIRKMPKQEISERVNRILETVHLEKHADHMPARLSGGQQQRIALGRALVAEPRVLLLDEPLSNLDAKLREEMRFEIKSIQEKLGITVVYVTHDQSEAMTMSDRVAVIRSGIAQQVGSPMEIYQNPANQFIADFVGKISFLKGTSADGKICIDGTDDVLSYSGTITGQVDVGIRPENIRIVQGNAQMHGTIVSEFFMGESCDCRVRVGDAEVRVHAASADYTKLGRGTPVGLDLTSFLVFPAGEDDFRTILT